MVDVVPVGHLIADISEDGRLLFAFVFYGLAQDIYQCDALRTPSLAKVYKELVEQRVLQGMVQLSTLRLRTHPQGKRGNPFPVEDMS